MSIRISALQLKDRDAWQDLFRRYVEFYKADFIKIDIDEVWRRIHDVDNSIHALGAFDEDRLVAITHFVTRLSTWSSKPFIYLEDLYTDIDYRKQGIGAKLIDAVKCRGEEMGAGRLYWVTQESNKTAQALYDTIAEKTDFIQYRITL